MTTLLEQAFAEAASLPPAEQDALGAWIMEELRAEQRWQGSFDHSLATLEQLADEAFDELRAVRTRQLPTKRA